MEFIGFNLAVLGSMGFWVGYIGFGVIGGLAAIKALMPEWYSYLLSDASTFEEWNNSDEHTLARSGQATPLNDTAVPFLFILGLLVWPVTLLLAIGVGFFKLAAPLLRALFKQVNKHIPEIEIKFPNDK